MLKKADVALIVFLLLAGLGSWLAVGFSQGTGSTVVLTVDGQPYASYSLAENQSISIDQAEAHNLIAIENGAVRMEESNCTGQQCVYQGSITHSGESIICLPHRIVIEITGEDASYDAVAS